MNFFKNVLEAIKSYTLQIILGIFILIGMFYFLGAWSGSSTTSPSQSGNASVPMGQRSEVQAAPWPAERLISLKAGVKSEVIIFPTGYAPQWRIVGPGKQVAFFFNFESVGVMYDADHPQAEAGTKILSSAEMVAQEDTKVLFSFVR